MATMSAHTRRHKLVPTLVMLVGALYCLAPIAWLVIASSKPQQRLFTSSTLEPGTALWDNIKDLLDYGNGAYVHWVINTIVYAFGGATLSTVVSCMGGYALAKFRFRGRDAIFRVLLAGVLIPGVTLAVPQYFIMAKLGLANTYWSVLLPVILSPFGIYLCRVYAGASVSNEMLEAARMDGASELRVFRSVVVPVMLPGLVTVFLLQLIWIWNNFLLPYLMLSDQNKFPLTLGLYSLLSRGSGEPALYTEALVGSLLSVIPLIALIMFLQRFWRLDLVSGGVKG